MADSEDKSTDVRHVQDQLASAFESTVLESVGMRDDVASTGEDATRASVASAVNQMVSMGISDKDRHPGHGHSSSQSEDTRHCVKNQPPVKPLKGQEGHGSRGDVQSEQGWRSVHDAVSYQPPEKVIDSVVKRCGAEWYRVGIRLGYNDSQVTAITHHIPTPEGKLEAIIQRKLMKESRGEVAEALLDVCDQLMPLTVVSVMEDLGIQYLVSDHLLYEVGREVAGDWKVVARCLGLTAQDMAYIRVKAKSARNRARTMLKLSYAKIRSNVSVQKIHEILQQLRTRKAKPRQNSQIFPANIHVNHRLCGRENELEGIARAFWGEASDKEAPTEIAKYCLQIVSGLGGIGKTAISEKYAVEWMKKYLDGVFHFNAESLSSLHISIKNNLRELSLESGGGGVLDDNKILLQCISDKDRVLLIYDGADDLDLLNSVLPGEMSHVHVLVTTRMSDDHPIRTRADKVTCLGRLGVCAGVEALQELSGHASEILHEEELMFARRLVDESPIEGLPLAIAHAATSIRLGKMKYEQYYELLKKRQAALQALALDMDKLLHYFKITSLNEELMQLGITKPGDLLRLTAEDIQALSVDTNKKRLLGMAVDFLANSNPVHLTWQLDIETVKDRDSNAMNLLSYASLLSPRNISERVLRPLLYSDDIFALQYRISLSTLRAHSLVDVRESNEGCRLDMHPLVHSTVLERVMREPEALQYRLNRLADSLLNLIPIGDNDIMRSMRDNDFLSLIPHVYAVAEKALWIQDDQKCNLLVATACRIASRFQHRDVFVRLCEQRLQYVSTNNIRRVEALFLMAKSCNLVANYQLAQTHLMEALQILESSSDCDEATLEHCYILVLSQLSACYQHQQMYSESVQMSEIRLSLLRNRPAANKTEIINSLFSLAHDYEMSGQIQKATEICEEALKMETEDPQPLDLNWADSLQYMGYCLINNGEYERALPILNRCLSIRRDNLPEDHIDLAIALHALSVCCEKLDDMPRAKNFCEESLAIARCCLPNDHPQVAVFVSQLSSCQQSAGHLDQAIQLLQQSIEILRKGLPSTRREFCGCLNNIGQLYTEMLLLDEAISVHEECLAAQREFLNPVHPDIAITLYNLGTAYKVRNNLKKAIEVWRECLSVGEKCFPSTHPCLVKVLTAIGIASLHEQQYEESLQVLGRLRDIHMTVSPNSLETAYVCQHIGLAHRALSQFSAAEKAILQAQRICTALLPPGDKVISFMQLALEEIRQSKVGQW